MRLFFLLLEWIPEFLPLDPMANKTCNIECCGNKINQIVINMLSQYLEVKLSLS